MHTIGYISQKSIVVPWLLFCLVFVVVWWGGVAEGGEVALGKNKMI
jgi:hypothetical protein